LGVKQGTEAAEGRKIEARPLLVREVVAGQRVQHPPGDGNLYPIREADDHDVGVMPAQRLNQLNFRAEECMVAVADPQQGRFMSSMRMDRARCGNATAGNARS